MQKPTKIETLIYSGMVYTSTSCFLSTHDLNDDTMESYNMSEFSHKMFFNYHIGILPFYLSLEEIVGTFRQNAHIISRQAYAVERKWLDKNAQRLTYLNPIVSLIPCSHVCTEKNFRTFSTEEFDDYCKTKVIERGEVYHLGLFAKPVLIKG